MRKIAFWATFGVLSLIVAPVLIFFVVLIIAVPFNSRTGSETDLAKSRMLSAPPAPLSREITLRIVTFNIQDLLVVAKDHVARMKAIGETLTELDPDIVGIQEGFIGKHRNVLLDALTRSRLKHHQYYPSATVGSGKFVLSAYPIAEAFFHRYTVSNPWYKFYEGDWWAGKGVALARIQLPDGIGFIDFYNTHLQAGYGNTAYVPVREAQMCQLVSFLKTSTTGTSPALLVGDLNCSPDTAAFKIAQSDGGLERLMTKDSHIDHIMGMKNARYVFETIDTQPIDRTVNVPGGQNTLSDHIGYVSTVRIKPV